MDFKKCDSTTQVENLEVKSLSLSLSTFPFKRNIELQISLTIYNLRRVLLAHRSREQTALIDISLDFAYLLAALSKSTPSLLSPSSPSENQSPIKMRYRMPSVLKSQVRQIKSEKNHVIHATALGPEWYFQVLCILCNNNYSFVYQNVLIELFKLRKLNSIY